MLGDRCLQVHLRTTLVIGCGIFFVKGTAQESGQLQSRLRVEINHSSSGLDAPEIFAFVGQCPLLVITGWGIQAHPEVVVEGWVDEQGQLQDKVFDVVWSGQRKAGSDGKLPAVGNTVDLTTATYRNTIGNAQLAMVWEDPEFDPAKAALYYARVLEIPTPRWSTYDAVRAGLPLLDGVAATIQERAWSSPIWYRP